MMIGLPGITLRFRRQASMPAGDGLLTETGLILLTEAGQILARE